MSDVLTKYPTKVKETQNHRLNHYHRGNYIGRKCVLSLFDYDTKNNTYSVMFAPSGCREVFAGRAFGRVHYYAVPKDQFKRNVLNKSYRLLYIRFFSSNKRNMINNIRILNEVEERCGLNKSKVVTADNKTFLILMPREWFYNNVILSTVLLFLRNDNIVYDDYFITCASVMINNRKEIFQNNAVYKVSYVGLSSFKLSNNARFNAARKKFFELGGVFYA